MKRHPLTQRVDYASKVIPLRLFGDGIAVLGVGKSWGRSVDAFTIQPLLSQLPGKFSTILLSLVWKGRRDTRTLPRMWQILVWSLTALADGRYPALDWRGQKFPEGSEEAILANRFLAGGFAASVVALASEKASCLWVSLLGERNLWQGAPNEIHIGQTKFGPNIASKGG